MNNQTNERFIGRSDSDGAPLKEEYIQQLSERREQYRKNKEESVGRRKLVYELRFVHRLTFEAIGRRLGISRQRAHQLLKEEIKRRSNALNNGE